MTKTLYFNPEKCVGCYASAVACMDQNDIDLAAGQIPFRNVVSYEGEKEGEVWTAHVSMACQHCESAECLDACPSRALRRDPATGAVVVRAELCIGCHACAMACPFGVPRFGADGVMSKCDACYARTRFGLDPACTDVCPTGALEFLDINEAMARKQQGFGKTLVQRKLTR